MKGDLMTEQKKPKCESCVYYAPVSESEHGLCHRRSPASEHGGVAYWPRVRSYSWCGEHEPVRTELVVTPIDTHQGRVTPNP